MLINMLASKSRNMVAKSQCYRMNNKQAEGGFRGNNIFEGLL